MSKIAKYWRKNLNGSPRLLMGEGTIYTKLFSMAMDSERILQIGVGKWRMANLLINNGVKSNFYGIDLINFPEYKDKNAIVGDARKLPFKDDFFDLVYSLGVIEHFPETFLSLLEHSRVTKKGGHVLITVPNLSLLTPLRYITYIFRDNKYGSFEQVRGRSISLRQMKGYFQSANLIIEDYGFYGIYGIGKFFLKSSCMHKIATYSPFGAYIYIIGVKQ